MLISGLWQPETYSAGVSNVSSKPAPVKPGGKANFNQAETDQRRLVGKSLDFSDEFPGNPVKIGVNTYPPNSSTDLDSTPKLSFRRRKLKKGPRVGAVLAGANHRGDPASAVAETAQKLCWEKRLASVAAG